MTVEGKLTEDGEDDRGREREYARDKEGNVVMENGIVLMSSGGRLFDVEERGRWEIGRTVEEVEEVGSSDVCERLYRDSRTREDAACRSLPTAFARRRV